ncbi:MAG: RHH-type proline utilization regulon transcriptional repressor/proline dehydrogenase [Porticoccus sp.]|jgi:RHH-type proline utilization regulon transcriptional repressor/proline dehydrogenase/delta 1-pyrroline-5-carboxylate dehydrogenase
MQTTFLRQSNNLDELREQTRIAIRSDESAILAELVNYMGMSSSQRCAASESAGQLVGSLRRDNTPSLMEVFLAEYALTTDEGIALMCLAEALLRIPDNETIEKLIEDKTVPLDWIDHLAHSPSSLVNAATLGLMVASKILDESASNTIVKVLRGVVKRLGTPVIRAAVNIAMTEMGRQFVLGESIEAALDRSKKSVKSGYQYAFDMLGEAALTALDAGQYFRSYKHAIEKIGAYVSSDDICQNPSISIKLSALHPRYEVLQRRRVLEELVPVVLELALLSKSYNIGLTIDAEEADRLDLSLDVIQTVFENSQLAGWGGFGVVVQAYNKSSSYVLDWLYKLASNNDRRIMVRLVKGAYWDTEIKRAQVEGLKYFPVFTRKDATDVSYLCCAKKMMEMSDRIYSQFATHNAHTIAAIMQIAGGKTEFEFQRLHGMGESVYRELLTQYPVRRRIYAPVGHHKDLLAYLVRRLLENGANSSFVNQVIDNAVPVEKVVADPFEDIKRPRNSSIINAVDLFQPERINASGIDLHDYFDIQNFLTGRNQYKSSQWYATPLLAGSYEGCVPSNIVNPADLKDKVGKVIDASHIDVKMAIDVARPWAASSNSHSRASVLTKVSDLYEEQSGEIFALLTREAGKTAQDAIAEIREAVDFLRYYAAQACKYDGDEALGVFVCISPWNFPLAIFTGQICAALAAGNGVLAKPAETTPLIAFFAIKLFYQAGVPSTVLQLLPGGGGSVGAQLVSDPSIAGVCFTGSTATAISINRSMAKFMQPTAPLIAETGGLNAMIVDSTALPEQVIKDIVRSAFQSAGQRCSALRLLYLQDDIYDTFMEMLSGAIDELKVGDPWNLETDVGPLITRKAREDIQAYVDKANDEGRVFKQLAPRLSIAGSFIYPAVLTVSGIKDMKTEIFGPVLHVAKFSAKGLATIVTDINDSGYGLTFGVHSRIDSTVDQLVNSLNVGNIYVNRDQIGAVVGSQPFGGENLSGTGPKAGGPNYLTRFFAPTKSDVIVSKVAASGRPLTLKQLQVAVGKMPKSRVKIGEQIMPGPTGESNVLYRYARGLVLCLGASLEDATAQASIVKANGCQALVVCPGAVGENSIDGFFPRKLLADIKGIHLVALWSDQNDLRETRQALAMRDGQIIPIIGDLSLDRACVLERHVCIDTTAAGGNALLLATAY